MKPMSILISAAIAVLPCCGCADAPQKSSYSKAGLYFDTVVEVTVYSTSESEANAILDECMDICSHYQDLFDKNTKTSDIARINNAGTAPTHVDHDTAVLISEALRYCEESGGRFDITINPVSVLWDFHEGSERIPSKSELENALGAVGYKNVTVDADNDTITLALPDASVDLGAAAKGFVADKIAACLADHSITGAIINMGGDMYLSGSKPDNSLFNIGINDPFEDDGCIMSLYMSDMAVATSGTYERYIISDGRKYHHILDTSTGMPVDTDIESVTVIAERAIDSDCLCTLSMILGSKKALQMIEEKNDTEAVLILSDGSIVKSSGADRYIRQ